MTTIDKLTQPTGLTLGDAAILAGVLNSDSDDGWTYHVVIDPKAPSVGYVECRDEDGVAIGRL